MRKTFIITNIVFTVIAIIFTILPMGTIALLPVIIAIILAFLAVLKSLNSQKNLPKILLIISISILLLIVGREVFVEDKVEVDKVFMQENENSKQEAQKDLEELDGLDSIR